MDLEAVVVVVAAAEVGLAGPGGGEHRHLDHLALQVGHRDLGLSLVPRSVLLGRGQVVRRLARHRAKGGPAVLALPA